MKKSYIYILSFLLFLFFVFGLQNFCYAKYVINNNFSIANINIDNLKPKIELISINNSNVNYEKYSNKNHNITIKIKVIEKNIFINNITKDNIIIYSGEKNIVPTFNYFKLILEKDDYKIYEFSITNLTGDRCIKNNIS